MTQSWSGMTFLADFLNAGNAVKVKKIAKARWIERASVSLNTPIRNMNGKGEAYHNWNNAQIKGTKNSILPEIPTTVRAPLSDSATIAWSPSRDALSSFFRFSAIFLSCCLGANAGRKELRRAITRISTPPAGQVRVKRKRDASFYSTGTTSVRLLYSISKPRHGGERTTRL